MALGEELRALMRSFPSGVAVVTVSAGAERAGLTVGSLVWLSLEPPLVGVAINRESPFHELLRAAEGFAVSLLSAGQEGLAQHFARSGMPPAVRWQGIRTRPGPLLGAPLLEGALGWIEAHRSAEHEAGSHTFFVGEALGLERGPGAGALAYRDGRYHPL